MSKSLLVNRYHYSDVRVDAIASQITSLTIVYSNIYSSPDQSKHQSSASLAFVWGIHRRPVNSPHKWPVTRKMFPFDDVFMFPTWLLVACWHHSHQPIGSHSRKSLSVYLTWIFFINACPWSISQIVMVRHGIISCYIFPCYWGVYLANFCKQILSQSTLHLVVFNIIEYSEPFRTGAVQTAACWNNTQKRTIS